MRAALNSIFAANLKKTTAERDLYASYLSGVVLNLESPALNISTEGKDSTYKLLESSEWKNVLDSFNVFSEKFNLGDYGVDSKVFFKNITNRIDAIYEIIKIEQNLSLKAICILPKKEIGTGQLALIKAIVTRLELIYVIFSSHYYKNSRSVFKDND